MSGRTQNGFSLIELLIVVAIVLIITAIALPNLIQAKVAANQASAVQSLRTIGSAVAVYSSSYQDGYPPSLAVLGPPAGLADCNAAGLVDSQLVSGAKSGYQFAWHVGSAPVTGSAVPSGCVGGYLDMYSVTADPFGFPTGRIHYCVDATGVIRQNTSAITTTPADGCDPASQAIGN